MSGASKIEWTERTWNPVRGCSMAPGSEAGGCLNCYAARIAARGLPGMNSPSTGEPFAVLRESGPRWTGKVELIESMLDVPLRRKKPTTYFVNSMSDLFHESLADRDIQAVFGVMSLCSQHTFQVLTKRPARMKEWFAANSISECQAESAWREVALDTPVRHLERGEYRNVNRANWPLPNVWLGVSAENQAMADVRIPLLLQTPAALRFVSIEPMLGPINMYCGLPTLEIERESGMWRDLIRWVICGGESGPGARAMEAEWAKHLRDQCNAAEVPFFFKQWGEWLPGDQDGAALPEGQTLNYGYEPIRVGKLAAGCLLDGREWKEMPEGVKA